MREFNSPDISQDKFEDMLQNALDGDPKSQFYVGQMYFSGVEVDKDYAKALEFWRMSAEQSYIPSLISLGCFFFDTNNPEYSIDQAKTYFEQAAKLHSGEAWRYLGKIYLDPEVNDISKAQQCFEKAVELDDAEAYYELAYMHYTKLVLKPDLKRAKELFIKACTLKNPQAFFFVGMLDFAQNGDLDIAYNMAAMSWNCGAILGDVNCLEALARLLRYNIFGYEGVIRSAVYWVFAADFYCDITSLDISKIERSAPVDIGSNLKAVTKEIIEKDLENIQYQPKKDPELFLKHACGLDLPRGLGVSDLILKLKKADELYFLATKYFAADQQYQDYTLAVLCFRSAALLGHALAQTSFGLACTVKESVLYDPEEAVYWLNQAIAQGESSAMYALAKIYLKGLDYIKPNPELAVSLLRKAFAAGDKRSGCALGDCLLHGVGVEQDVEAALKLFEESYPFGLVSLGDIYLKGDVVDQDFSQARGYYKQAILANLYEVCRPLGHIYEYGLGIPVNRSRAQEVYELGIEHGDQASRLALADLCFEGVDPNEPDYVKARELYNMFVFKKDPEVLSRLGWMFLFGKGGEAKPEVGLKLLSLAADKNHPFALYHLGLALCHGKLIQQNVARGVAMLTKSAQAGFDPAIKALKSIEDSFKA